MEQTDYYYMSLAQSTAKESHCLRRKVGAILVTQNTKNIVRAINNPVPDKYFCEKEGCLREKGQIASGTQIDICRCVHAETSLIIQCALNGISPAGASVYTTLFPCPTCARVLSAAGIRKVVFLESYSNLTGQSTFLQYGIELTQMTL